ncbi:MAG: N-acetyl-gamma-glutamyl-phosphate reductase [Candidatus Wallacebacter cryptica]|jgi:N-acetyl-gamma-glutamyl-phosphate reductase
MLKVGVIGASGYTGGELLRLLVRHPKVKITAVSARTSVGQTLEDINPALNVPDLDLKIAAPEAVDDCEVVFLAVPHGVSSELAVDLIKAGQKVIDLGADFRLKDRGVYEKWYQQEHGAPELLGDAVYGLPEIHRDQIRKSTLIGNPGCYPTSIILALAPILKAGIGNLNSIIINSLSGVSGAGRGLGERYHFSHCAGNLTAYGVGSHRHLPEIEQELSGLVDSEVRISFTPHLVPAVRGILTTITLGVDSLQSTDELIALYREFYQNEFFIRIQPPGVLPQTKYVIGSNFCDLGAVYDSRTRRAVIVSAIDNLGKGAASQAVQNLNIMAGWSERLGIDHPAMYP